MEEEICSEEVSCFTGSLAPFKDDLVFPEDVNFAALTELLDRNEVIMDTVNTIKLWVSLSSHPFLPYKLSKAFRPIQKVKGRSPQIGTKRVSVTSAKTYFFP